ncbi:pectinesterase family protein [Rhizobium oryzicola]|uniref:Pectinesterase n=1 Tax=Rhizobium oryzicola TaxID=1232668 RepID=A0ABT8T1P7_9HYPH|nr:pectinesterase family protein [Rhizobium oryzicola]MDO1584670.1 pectinesterase family protein [Rhizobium oryzicola]
MGLHLIGWQDTLYAGSHGCNGPESCRPTRQYYEDALIEGSVDFVFGDALAWFERPELRGVNRGKITVTAQSRRVPQQRSGYVFHDCKVTGDASVQTISLGRPWRDYATVTYIDCWLDARVLPEGFTEWQGEHRLPTARYMIIDATGPGSDTNAREPWMISADAEARSILSTPERYFAEYAQGGE